MRAMIVIALGLLAFLQVSTANEERIVGGQIAKKKFRRHLAYLWISKGDGSGFATCTGSIVGRRWILSAAHCFDGIKFGDVSIEDSFLYVGSRTANPGPRKRKYFFRAAHIHRGYSSNDPASRNDVAVVELSQNIRSGQYFPVKLTEAPKDGTRVIVAGYGVLNENGREARFAMQATVVAENFGLCRARENRFVGSKIRRRTHVCAVSLGFPDKGRTDTCYGDSGGPLYSRESGKVMQYGITSFATTGCAEPGGIPWYARASSYRKPINEVISTGSARSFNVYF